jgi:3D-(3,5/4)-trihydroxycyclohexane-1,2-dione acylhydrolase (decyclizing)
VPHADPANPLRVVVAAHAAAMGAASRHCDSLADLAAAPDRVGGNDRTTLVSIATDACAAVPGSADWDLGVPEVSDRESLNKARAHQQQIRARQKVGI